MYTTINVTEDNTEYIKQHDHLRIPIDTIIIDKFTGKILEIVKNYQKSSNPFDQMIFNSFRNLSVDTFKTISKDAILTFINNPDLDSVIKTII